MANYMKLLKSTQREPIFGREDEMTRNAAGGYSFKIDKWQALKRWLVIGSECDMYYDNAAELTRANIDNVIECVKEDPAKTAEIIIECDKICLSNSSCLLALAVLADKAEDKQLFHNTFDSVVRTLSHLYEFLEYVSEFRRFGRTIRRAVHRWFNRKDRTTDELTYQILKYQKRGSFSITKILRLMHVKPRTPAEEQLFRWAIYRECDTSVVPEQLRALLSITSDMTSMQLAEMIRKYKFTWEMISGYQLADGAAAQSPEIWKALYANMPIEATIRNLGNLSNKGVFDDTTSIELLEHRLLDKNVLRTKMNPVKLAMALQVYQRGRGHRGSLSWTPNPHVSYILEQAVEMSFDVTEVPDKNILHAIDTSGSMTVIFDKLCMSCAVAACLQALAAIRQSRPCWVIGFDVRTHDLTSLLHKSASFSSVAAQAHSYCRGGGTDLSVPFEWALENNVGAFDAIVVWTDNMTWAGRNHPTQMIEQYRRKVNKAVKVVYVTMAPYAPFVGSADPADPLQYDIVGMSGGTVQLVNAIINGALD